MGLIKTVVVSVFSVTALLCVGYAHSQSKQTIRYSDTRLGKGACTLEITKTNEGAVFNAYGKTFKASPLLSQTGIPSEPGEKVFESDRKDEWLSVQFDLKQGEVQPLRFLYRDKRQHPFAAGPYVCGELQAQP